MMTSMWPPRPVRHAIAMLLTSACASGVFAQSVPLQQLTASPPTRGEYFGARVSLYGEVALVGSPEAKFNLAAVTSGEAHVFRHSADGLWLRDAILQPTDATRAVSFGMGVSVSGDVAVVAGYQNQACREKPLCIRGAAWVFRYDYVARAWHQEQELVPADA